MDLTVFISHKTEDTAVATQLCDYLEANRIHCWIACRDEEVGWDYGAQIVEAIARVDAFVLILSSHCNRTPQYIVSELDCAFRRSLPIIVFRTENARPCKALSLYVASAHWLDAFQSPAEQYCRNLWIILRRRAFEQHLKAAMHLLQEHRWVLSTQTCGTILERAMQELLIDLRAWIHDPDTLKEIRGAEERIGLKKTTLAGFGLSQLVTLYRDADVMGELRKQLTSRLQRIKDIRWASVVGWYETAQKRGHGRIRAEDAQKMYDSTRIFLYDCELAGDPWTVDVVEGLFPEKCAICQRPVEEGWNYCPQCGSRLISTCEACHRPVQADWRRCPYCETLIAHRGSGEDGLQGVYREYTILCQGAYIDRVVNVRERRELERRRLELGLDTEEANKIEGEVAPPEIWEYMHMVKGVLVDGIIDEQERVFLNNRAKKLKIDPWVQKRIEEAETAIRNGALDNPRHSNKTV